jgi:N-acetylmuramoyl-L-alanine amidase
MNKIYKQTPFKKSRGNNPLDTVIIHHIGSSKGKLYSVKGTITWFTSLAVHRNKETGKIENQVSAHYVIPREPYKGYDLVQLAHHSDITYHAGRSLWKYAGGKTKSGLNKNSIGIELAGDGNLVPYTDFQYQVLIKLLKEIRDEYGLPIENILGHEDVAPSRKVDPGKFFEWDKVREALTKTVLEMPEIVIKPKDPNPKEPEEDDDKFFMAQGVAPEEANQTAAIFVKIVDFLNNFFEVLVNK